MNDVELAYRIALPIAALAIGLLAGRILFCKPVVLDRRAFSADQEKFSTQRSVTFILLGVFVGVCVSVFTGEDQSERSTVMQTVINLVVGAVGYWLGASKSQQDQAQAMSRMAESVPVAAALAAEALKKDNVNTHTNTADNVDITANTATVTTNEQPKQDKTDG